MDKIKRNKKITCAIVIINKDGDILGCHPTNHNDVYDFPKGCADRNEIDRVAAIRELKEETDLNIFEDEELIDCGIFKHNKEKNIHIFLYKVNTFPDLTKLKCNSFFEYNGKQIPEVDKYCIIKKNERNKFMHVLQNKFKIIDKFNK